MNNKRLVSNVLVVLMALPLSTAARASQAQSKADGQASVVSPEDREKVVQLVMKEGATRGQAEQIVDSLDPEDIAVYAENPEMMESGGILFTLLIIALICLLIAAINSD